MDHTLRVYESILELLPSEENPTPLVRLQKTVPEQFRVYAKLEWYNPFGAVKDRIAANMLRDAERRGLTPLKRLIEPTSGNTGIGLAMMANAHGFALRTPVSQAIPQEKKTTLRFLGSDVVEIPDSLCPDPSSPDGAIATAKGIARSNPDQWHMLNQYENDANIEAHYRTTGPEIWRQTAGRVTHFIAALGTCGTITGTGRFLKERNPDVKVIGVHPQEGHEIPGVRSIKQLQVTKLFHPEEYDALVEVSNDEAYDLCLRLNREESVIAGPSSGLALAGALKALGTERDALAVVIFPDNIFKYASFLEKHFPQFAGAAQHAPVPAGQDPLLAAMLQAARNPHTTLEAEEALPLVTQQAAALVDVRPAQQYLQGHLPGAVNIPLLELSSRAARLPRERPVITVCNRGNASISGMLLLRAMGFQEVRSLNGGTIGWREKGYPLER